MAKGTFVALFPMVVFAQAGIEGDVDNELDQLYAAPVQQVRPQPAPVTVQANPPYNGGQPIYILNQAPNSATQTQATSQIQKQPTTFVEATPLSDSQADRMRKARQEAEMHTETKIVEKLESSRMDDEKRRAQVLFGDKFDRLAGQEAGVATPVQQQAPPPAAAVVPPVVPQQVQIQVVPAPAPTPEPEVESTRDIIREELQSAMQVEQDLPPQPIEKKYFGAILGSGEYQDVKNVTWNYSFGFTFGTKYDDTFAIEGTFLFTNYTIRAVNPTIGGGAYGYGYGYGGGYGGGYRPYSATTYNDDVNQYSGSLAMKYFLFSGMVRPVVGGLVEYSYRTHTTTDYYNRELPSNQKVEVNSHAIDLGGIIGAEVEFSKKVSVGLDFRYLFNLSSRINSSNAVFTEGSLTEKLNRYVFAITGKASF
ncbi:MAG: hypothetical protein JNM39_13840 [Bdellovibrionaceae bacterium]|nr:hypothetical protein [Pseudobdellovibrionaceae bacterium]